MLTIRFSTECVLEPVFTARHGEATSDFAPGKARFRSHNWFMARKRYADPAQKPPWIRRAWAVNTGSKDENGNVTGYEWEPADAVTKLTAQGKPVVAAWHSGSSNISGHVAMMLPPQPGDTTMMLAQAGGNNYNSAPLEWGFGKDKWPTISFYYHD